jgi:hypothetical protein
MTQPLLFDAPASAKARDRGTARALVQAAWWRKLAEHWLLCQPEGRTFTADDLVHACGLPSPDGRNNGVGAFLRGLAVRGIIEAVGYDRTRRVVGHARMVRVWRVR